MISLEKKFLVIGGAFFAFLALIFILYFFSLFAWMAALCGLSILIVTVLITVGTFLIMLFALPYYLLKKKPEVQEYGNYELEEED